MLKHILVPLDGSEVSERALEFARQVVGRDGRITLLTVVDLPEYPTAMFYPAGIASYDVNVEKMQDQLVPQADAYLQKTADTLRAAGYHVDLTTVIGEPASSIVEQADEYNVDAIVMSTHGRSGLSRWLFGSVANKVLSGTRRPILIVPVKR
ncbi:MAG: universal stress protein [Chloroflexota bacterium]